MNASPDRLYELLPAVYRQRDLDQGQVLRALLRIVAGQMNLVEAELAEPARHLRLRGVGNGK